MEFADESLDLLKILGAERVEKVVLHSLAVNLQEIDLIDSSAP